MTVTTTSMIIPAYLSCRALTMLGYSRAAFPPWLLETVVRRIDLHRVPVQMLIPVLHLVLSDQSQSGGADPIFSPPDILPSRRPEFSVTTTCAATKVFRDRLLSATLAQYDRPSSLTSQISNHSALQSGIFSSLRQRCENRPQLVHRLKQEHGVFVDFALRIGDREYAVEVDGPAHFCTAGPRNPLSSADSRWDGDDPRAKRAACSDHPREQSEGESQPPNHHAHPSCFDRPLGRTLLKRRVLGHLGAREGFGVISIPYFSVVPIAQAKQYDGGGRIETDLLWRCVRAQL